MIDAPNFPAIRAGLVLARALAAAGGAHVDLDRSGHIEPSDLRILNLVRAPELRADLQRLIEPLRAGDRGSTQA
ncbi:MULTISPECIES: hypothetical protein [unclassified Sphingomonas]|uniref:hypothetical protein n=1 Tax=unclassified Sphingomonas TaxID=196159 RepID=UPI002150BE7B|nr:MULTISPECIES: hypothetical protein [unclassified Sphingomonas]MCR5869468.1 hypothetical protein [Sphingomonas sp. J344]UUX98803.1 hypothetical protein LRS08_14955 [Sphingomonas sp. J315]